MRPIVLALMLFLGCTPARDERLADEYRERARVYYVACFNYATRMASGVDLAQDIASAALSSAGRERAACNEAVYAYWRSASGSAYWVKNTHDHMEKIDERARGHALRAVVEARSGVPPIEPLRD